MERFKIHVFKWVVRSFKNHIVDALDNRVNDNTERCTWHMAQSDFQNESLSRPFWGTSETFCFLNQNKYTFHNNSEVSYFSRLFNLLFWFPFLKSSFFGVCASHMPANILWYKMFSNPADLPPAKNKEERTTIIQTASKQKSDYNNPCVKVRNLEFLDSSLRFVFLDYVSTNFLRFILHRSRNYLTNVFLRIITTKTSVL